VKLYDRMMLSTSSGVRHWLLSPQPLGGATTLARFAEDSIAVAQQVARKLIKGERFSRLLSGPLRAWVGSHVAVDNAPTVMGQNQKHIENLENEGSAR
jgi:hypothetical protein